MKTITWITKLLEWSNCGERAFEFEARKGIITKAWCYDYDLMTGNFVEHGEYPPDTHEFLKHKKSMLESELAGVNNALGN